MMLLSLVAAVFLLGRSLAFIPIQNPIQEGTYFRVASYNAKYFETVNDPLPSLQNIAIDLTQLRVFTIILQEFPKTFFQSPYYPKLKEVFAAFGLPYVCECFLGATAMDYGVIFASRNRLTGCTALPLAVDEVGGHTAVEYLGRDIDLVAAHLEDAEGAGVERMAEMDLLATYIKGKQLDAGSLVIAIDTTEQYNSDPIWALRAALPIEDSFFMLDWTRPSYTSFQGVTRNYLFLPRTMKSMPVGSYVLQSMSDSFAAIMDLWRYPEQAKTGPAPRPDPLAGLIGGPRAAPADPMAGLRAPAAAGPPVNVDGIVNELGIAHLIPVRPGSPFVETLKALPQGGAGGLKWRVPAGKGRPQEPKGLTSKGPQHAKPKLPPPSTRRIL